MTYEEAFNIGSKCEGYVKCTFAIAKNPENNRLFSFQHGHFGRSESLSKLTEAVEEIGDLPYADETGGLSFDLPIVVADTQELSADGLWAKARLTRDALNLLARKMYMWHKNLYGTRRKYIDVWEIYKVVNRDIYPLFFKGQKELYETVQFDPNKPYGTRTEAGIKIPTYLEYLQQRNPDYYDFVAVQQWVADYGAVTEEIKQAWSKNIWIRKTAIDWYPTDIKNVKVTENGKQVLLSDALAEAEKRLDRAKAILATATAAAFIV